MQLTLVTGNPGKLAEWQRLFPAEFQLAAADIDLDEIQSLDLAAIATDKARRAYEQLCRAVLVEDVAAGLDKLGGLPGPFIKYFEKQLGLDALFQLAGREGEPVVAICTIAYFDGKHSLVATGRVAGTVCASRGGNGFGFDKNFVPDGQPRSYGEMVPAEKDSVSHRALAVRDLLPQLRQLLS